LDIIQKEHKYAKPMVAIEHQLQKPAKIIDEPGFNRLQKPAEPPSLYQTTGMCSVFIIFEI